MLYLTIVIPREAKNLLSLAALELLN